jgi:DNA polymerase delta subunit 1
MRIFEPVMGEKASSLLSGNHTRTVSIAAPSSSAIMKFAIKTATCLGCKAPLKRNPSTLCLIVEHAVCERCTDRLPELYTRQVSTFDALATRSAQLWTQCQRCQGLMNIFMFRIASSTCIMYISRLPHLLYA